MYRGGQSLKTKIIATIGPPRGEILDPDGDFRKNKIGYDELLPWFVEEGVNIFRLNMAFFADGKNERAIFKWLRNNRNRLARNVAIEGDLPGPKIRLGDFVGKTHRLSRGQPFDLYYRKKVVGDETRASVLLYDNPFKQMGEYVESALQSNQRREVFIDIGDGKVVLRAAKNSLRVPGVVSCTVEAIEKDGEVEGRQGVTLKNVEMDLRSFDTRDREAVDFLLEEGGDFLSFIAVSFVKKAEDILEVKHHVEDYFFGKLRRRGRKAKDEVLWEEARLRAPAIIAKIETKQGCLNIQEIVDVADAIMIARGDLGLQLDPEEVPTHQKDIIGLANLRGKPVITATQMLDSMERNMWPTRAEVTDVFNAIVDGTDAVMLSGETSKGTYPIQSIRMMVRIARKAEEYFENKSSSVLRFQNIVSGSRALLKDSNDRFTRRIAEANRKAVDHRLSKKERDFHRWTAGLYSEKLDKSVKQETTDHVSEATCILAEEPAYQAIIAATTSGRTARMVSRFRPNAKIIAAAHDLANARKLTNSYGVYTINVGRRYEKKRRKFRTPEEIFEQAIIRAKANGRVDIDDKVVFLAGVPLLTPGATNVIEIKEVT